MMYAIICYIGFPVVILTLSPPAERNQYFPNPLPLTTERIRSNSIVFTLVFFIEEFSSHQLGLVLLSIPWCASDLLPFTFPSVKSPIILGWEMIGLSGVIQFKLFWQKRGKYLKFPKPGLVSSACGCKRGLSDVTHQALYAHSNNGECDKLSPEDGLNSLGLNGGITQ